MASENGTIADIVAEMRSNEFDDPSFNVYSLVAARTLARGWADRIEAAVNQPVTNCNRLGNAIEEALSAPPRNCDMFSNANDALEAFENEKRETMIEFVRWLFAEAKGCAKYECVTQESEASR